MSSSEELRAQFDHQPGDHALTRPRSRAPSTIVDSNTARLLGTFRTPMRIVDAVIAFAAAERVDPREALERSYPILKDLLGSGVLVPADSDLAAPIGPSLEDGATIAGFEIVRVAHVMIDTELYLAMGPDRGFAAIKVARPGAEDRMRPLFRREAAILGALGGRITPRLLADGDDDGCPFIAMSWHPGVSADVAAAEWREADAEGGRRGQLDLCRSIVAAYAALHASHVLHGDVHPSNVVVSADGVVTLIDFGLASPEGDAMAPRGGVDFFMDPETAFAQLEHRPPDPPTAAGEQYSVAALVTYLLTGAHTHDFSLEPEAMGRQLLDDPPVPFARRGVRGLEHVESVLARALSKRPDDRFEDMDAMLAAWDAAVDAGRDRSTAVPRVANGSSEAARLLDDTLVRLSIGGPLLEADLVPPTASVNLGAAGIAYGLLRIAMARDDEALLALADVWSTRALAAIGTEEAFVNREIEITPEVFGTGGVHHSAAGVYATAAMIAIARGDEIERPMDVAGVVAAAADQGDQRDVSFGTAGVLLSAATLLEALPSHAPERDAVRELGDRLADQAWDELSAPGPIGSPDQRARVRHLGGAHGWGGMLYAQLRWTEATGRGVRDGLGERLRELGELALPFRRGLVWPREVGAPDDGALSSSWCNGAAGMVALWTSAAAVLPQDGFDRLAEGAAWTAFDGPSAPGDLCCGLGGRAYALLTAYRATGDDDWLARAWRLGNRAAIAARAESLRRDSLYKGEIGVAVLAADLSRPSESAMPFYDREAWPPMR